VKFSLAEVTFGSVSPPLLLLMALVAAGYAKRAHALAGTRRAVPVARQISFYFAVFLLVAEPLSPLGPLDARSFTAHMIEHLIVGDIAALFMVLGLTGPLIQPLLSLRLVAAVRPIAHPAPALAIWIASTYLWQLPFMFNAALHHDGIHVLEHMVLFGAAFNLWMPLFGPLPQPVWFNNVAKLFYVAATWIAMMLLGNFFVFSSTAYYAQYVTSNNPFGLSPGADQSIAGAAMMIECTFVTFIILAWLFFKAASEGEESQRLIELANEHGVELSSARSDRAVAAGTADLLRERIVPDLDKPKN
jgi:putative membrane protein